MQGENSRFKDNKKKSGPGIFQYLNFLIIALVQHDFKTNQMFRAAGFIYTSYYKTRIV